MTARLSDPDISVEAGQDSAGREAIRMTLLGRYADALLAHSDGLTPNEASDNAPRT